MYKKDIMNRFQLITIIMLFEYAIIHCEAVLRKYYDDCTLHCKRDNYLNEKNRSHHKSQADTKYFYSK